MVPQGHVHTEAGVGGGLSLGHRGQLRNRQERARPGSQRNPLLAWLASPCLTRHACLCHDGVIRHRANTGPLLKKRDCGFDRSIVLDPLVDPGNPTPRHEANPAAHPARPHSRMVVLAQGSSGQRTQSPSQENATVMLRYPNLVSNSKRSNCFKPAIACRGTSRVEKSRPTEGRL